MPRPLKTKQPPLRDDNKVTNRHLKEAESQAREMIAASTCPKCGSKIELQNIGEAMTEKPWRRNGACHTYYCTCPHHCWIGPYVGHPVEAANEWLKVVK